MNTRTAQQQTRHATSTLFILACIAACIGAVGCTTKADSNAAGTGGFVAPATGGIVAPATGGVPAGTGGVAAGTGGAATGTGGMAPAITMCGTMPPVPAGTGGVAAGTGGAATGTGGMAAGITMCGTTMCAPPPMGSPLAICCQADMTCGLGLGAECLPPMAPGVLDATCPVHMSPTGSMLPGCCNATKCGVMSASGLGCVERPKVAMFAGGPLTACACGTDGSTCCAPAGTGGTGTGGMGTGGMGTPSAACMTYCTCMTATCSTSTFPSAQTCQAFCATGSAAAVTCWNTHCTNAKTMGASHCAHALGDGTVCPAK